MPWFGTGVGITDLLPAPVIHRSPWQRHGLDQAVEGMQPPPVGASRRVATVRFAQAVRSGPHACIAPRIDRRLGKLKSNAAPRQLADRLAASPSPAAAVNEIKPNHTGCRAQLERSGLAHRHRGNGSRTLQCPQVPRIAERTRFLPLASRQRLAHPAAPPVGASRRVATVRFAQAVRSGPHACIAPRMDRRLGKLKSNVAPRQLADGSAASPSPAAAVNEIKPNHTGPDLHKLDRCLLCAANLDSVHSGMTKDVHFHVGGVCGDCAVQFLRAQMQPGDVDCPVCVKEKRPPEDVAKLQPPFFTFDATLTALAYVIGGRGYGRDEFYEMHESEEYETAVTPPHHRSPAFCRGGGNLGPIILPGLIRLVPFITAVPPAADHVGERHQRGIECEEGGLQLGHVLGGALLLDADGAVDIARLRLLAREPCDACLADTAGVEVHVLGHSRVIWSASAMAALRRDESFSAANSAIFSLQRLHSKHMPTFGKKEEMGLSSWQRAGHDVGAQTRLSIAPDRLLAQGATAMAAMRGPGFQSRELGWRRGCKSPPLGKGSRRDSRAAPGQTMRREDAMSELDVLYTSNDAVVAADAASHATGCAHNDEPGRGERTPLLATACNKDTPPGSQAARSFKARRADYTARNGLQQGRHARL
eukprot:jgi/Mesvir1/987/Mv17530-RA.1